MSNDIILSLKNQLANLQYGVDEETRAVAGSGNFSKRISIKGGVFRLMSGGKEVAAIEDRSMNIIFAKMALNPSRTYFAQTYREGERISPVCWSNDSKTPDSEVKNPQASSCDKCPMSVKGSGQGGGAACRLSWRTAVVLPNNPTGEVMQLVLPATSVFGKEVNGKHPFRAYVQMLASNNISAGRVITKMSFDTASPVPKLLFSPVGVVPPEDMDTVQAQGKSDAAQRAITLTVFQTDEGEGVEDPVPAPAATAEPTVRAAEGGEGKPAAASGEADLKTLLGKWGKK